MIKFAAILTSAAIACSGAAAPAREDIACRIAALRCNRPAVTCPAQDAWTGCPTLPGCTLPGCDLKDCEPHDCTPNDGAPDSCEPSDCGSSDCEPEVQPTQTPTVTPAPTQAPTATPVPTAAPTQAPTATPAPTEGTDELPGVSAYAQEVVRLVNIERENAGLAPLAVDATLSAAAQVRAQEIDVSFSHTRPDGTSCFTVLKDFGISYRACGENIAKGSPSPARVVEGWMNSAGHRANILNANFTAIGVGVYADAAGTLHWAQLFTA